jgi:integrase
MRGHVRPKQRGVWELVVDLGRDPLTHRRRQLSRTVRGTKREAQQALTALVAEVNNGREVGADLTLSEVLGRWLDLVAEDLSPTTLDEYRRIARVRIDPALGSARVRKLTARQLDAFYRSLLRDAGLAPATIRQVHAVIRRALAQAVKWGWLRANPAVDASPPRLRRQEVAPPGPADLEKLLSEAHRYGPDFAALLRVLAATGMRRGEVCGLRWSDLDVTSRTLVVQRAVASVGGEIVEKDTKTHAARRIALDDATLDALVAHRRAMDERAAACGAVVADDAFMFSTEPDCGRALHPDSVSTAFVRVRKRAGLDRVRLHDLRHMHATQLLAAGVPVRTVSGRLGHANAATTLNVYGHFLEPSDREAADVIGGLLPRHEGAEHDG